MWFIIQNRFLMLCGVSVFALFCLPVRPGELGLLKQDISGGTNASLSRSKVFRGCYAEQENPSGEGKNHGAHSKEKGPRPALSIDSQTLCLAAPPQGDWNRSGASVQGIITSTWWKSFSPLNQAALEFWIPLI